MSTISVTNINDGDAVTAASVNNQINTIVNDYNGGVTNANISASAAISADKLAGGVSGMFGAWQSWTPTITLGGGTTNGNAVITGAYIQIGKTVHFWMKYVLGSTTSFSGLTSITSTLPVTMSSGFNSAHTGGAFYGCALISGSYYTLTSIGVSTTTFRPLALNASATYTAGFDFGPSVPGAWTNGSSFFVTGTYEAA